MIMSNCRIIQKIQKCSMIKIVYNMVLTFDVLRKCSICPTAEEEKFKPRRVAVSSQEEEPQESGARLQKRTSSRCEEQLGLTQNPSSEEQQELAQDPNS